MGDLGTGGGLGLANGGNASSRRVCGRRWPQDNNNLSKTLRSPVLSSGQGEERGAGPSPDNSLRRSLGRGSAPGSLGESAPSSS